MLARGFLSSCTNTKWRLFIEHDDEEEEESISTVVTGCAYDLVQTTVCCVGLCVFNELVYCVDSVKAYSVL